MVKERPILFSGDMVRAILDGRKSMTRRVVKGATPHGDIEPHGDYGGEWFQWIDGDRGRSFTCPYGEVGDRLWFSTGDDSNWQHVVLTITDVRVERVQEISDADAVAEGFARDGCGGEGAPRTFARLWDQINGKLPGCSWADNPWVWCVTFERVKP